MCYVMRTLRNAGVESYSTFFLLLSFFSVFCVVVSINIYLNNCYLIKCNKQQEKYRVSNIPDSVLLQYHYSAVVARVRFV